MLFSVVGQKFLKGLYFKILNLYNGYSLLIELDNEFNTKTGWISQSLQQTYYSKCKSKISRIHLLAGFLKQKPPDTLPSVQHQQPLYAYLCYFKLSDPVGMYTSHVKGRQILLENPARESRAMKQLEEKQMRKRRDKEKKKLGITGKRQVKEKGIWKFDTAQAKFVFFFLFWVVFLIMAFFWHSRFDLFLPLHHL